MESSVMAARSWGPVKSGLSAKTEFCLPGVPPISFSDAIQLSASPQGLFTSMSSSDQTPAFFSTDLYQVSEYFATSMTDSSEYVSASESLVLFKEGNPDTPITLPYTLKSSTDEVAVTIR